MRSRTETGVTPPELLAELFVRCPEAGCDGGYAPRSGDPCWRCNGEGYVPAPTGPRARIERALPPGDDPLGMEHVAVYCARDVLDALLSECDGAEELANARLAYLATFRTLFGFKDEDNPPTVRDLLAALDAATA